MADDLSKQFNDEALAVYENAKRLIGYRATRFLQKVRKDGGVAAAKSWLKPRTSGSPTKGFLELAKNGRLDISLEAVVLQEPWNSLFTESELGVARERLARHGYNT